jgi:uncharacterized RDD family membrane protein YckC
VRAAAFGLDATLIGVVAALAGSDALMGPVAIVTRFTGGRELALAVAQTPGILDMVVVFVIAFLYFTLLTASTGSTLGKWLLGLKVVGTDGEPLGLARSAARVFGYIVSATPFGLGVLSVALDPDHRGFHDVVADSRVVHE